jgi:hypothetical protein
MRRISVVGVLAAMVIAAAVVVAAAPAGAAAFPKHVGGYIVHTPADVVVRSKLVVPELTCPAEGSVDQRADLGEIVYVGPYNFSSAAIRVECQGPTPSYTAILTINLFEEPQADPVIPGDHVNLTVRIGSDGSQSRIEDVTQGWSERLRNGDPVVAANVAFGVFRFNCASCWPLPQFSPARVSAMSVNGAPPSGASPLSFKATHGRVEAKPGLLNAAQTAFTLHWRFSCTPRDDVC